MYVLRFTETESKGTDLYWVLSLVSFIHISRETICTSVNGVIKELRVKISEPIKIDLCQSYYIGCEPVIKVSLTSYYKILI